jgi:hypothetical protein
MLLVAWCAICFLMGRVFHRKTAHESLAVRRTRGRMIMIYWLGVSVGVVCAPYVGVVMIFTGLIAMAAGRAFTNARADKLRRDERDRHDVLEAARRNILGSDGQLPPTL